MIQSNELSLHTSNWMHKVILKLFVPIKELVKKHMALNRLKELQAAYFESREIDSFEALADEMLMEQCLNSMHEDVKMFVWSKQPTTSEECAHYADIFYQMSRMSDSHARSFYDGEKNRRRT